MKHVKKFNENVSNEFSPKRIEDAVRKAEEAFWASIADSYPEVKTGDLDPGTVGALIIQMEKAVKLWLLTNHPDAPKD